MYITHILKNILKEGKIYSIKNFAVTKYKDKFNEVENNHFKLQFYTTNMVKEIDHDDNLTPRHFFEFVNFEDLQKHYGKKMS